MQYYLVAASRAAMVGIEKFSFVGVLPAQEAAFRRMYAGYIVIAGYIPAAWPSLPVSKFNSPCPAPRRRQRQSQRLLLSVPIGYGF